MSVHHHPASLGKSPVRVAQGDNADTRGCNNGAPVKRRHSYIDRTDYMHLLAIVNPCGIGTWSRRSCLMAVEPAAYQETVCFLARKRRGDVSAGDSP